jgi:hypothetical protein
MLWHILTFMGAVFMSSATPTGGHPTESMVAEPIEFIFKDVLLPEYYNEEKQEYELDLDELRQRGLVWKHSDIHPNDFEYIESYLGEWSRNPIHLSMIDDNDMFLQLKEFWKQETSDGLPDIDPSKFHSFLRAAIFFGIRGDACKRFAGNMVRMGLRGTHSQDILRDMDPELKSIEISWEFLLAFAAELECEVRESDETVILCSTDSRYGTILETKPKTTMKELRILSNVFSRNKNVGTHIAHSLVWFLWHLNLHGLDLSGCEMDRNDVDEFSQALFRIRDVGLKTMNVSQCSMPPGSLAIILPHLKYLTKLHVAWNNLNEEDCGAFAASTLLTELNISYCFEDSPGGIARILSYLKDLVYRSRNSPGSIARILPHLKYLTKLHASHNSFNEADRDALAKCTLLTELDIGRCFLGSPGNIIKILPYLKDLTKLNAEGNSLDEADCDALAASTLLIELDIGRCFKNSPGSIARILPHLNDLTKLYVSWNSFNEADRDALAACTLLTELDVSYCFIRSPGYPARIFPHLKNLTKLNAEGNILNEADCDALAKCTLLTELNVSYCFIRSPGYLAIILPHLKCLTKLHAPYNRLNEADRNALAVSTLLTELDVRYCSMTPGYLARILPRLKYLTKLDAHDNRLNKADRDALAASTLLIELNIRFCFLSSPGSIARILPHLKYLTKLHAEGNILNEADCDALAASTLLTELNVNYCFTTPGSIARILPHLKYLTKLHAYGNDFNEADREAIEAARERGVEVYITSWLPLSFKMPRL